MAVTKKALRVDLTNDSVGMFLEIKNQLNLRSDAEVVRFLIGRQYHRMKQEITEKKSRANEQLILTKADEELLVVAAEDFWERHHHFEEEAVRKFLQIRVSTRNWPELKLNQAVEFVCSQSRKN